MSERTARALRIIEARPRANAIVELADETAALPLEQRLEPGMVIAVGDSAGRRHRAVLAEQVAEASAAAGTQMATVIDRADERADEPPPLNGTRLDIVPAALLPGHARRVRALRSRLLPLPFVAIPRPPETSEHALALLLLGLDVPLASQAWRALLRDSAAQELVSDGVAFEEGGTLSPEVLPNDPSEWIGPDHRVQDLAALLVRQEIGAVEALRIVSRLRFGHHPEAAHTALHPWIARLQGEHLDPATALSWASLLRRMGHSKVALSLAERVGSGAQARLIAAASALDLPDDSSHRMAAQLLQGLVTDERYRESATLLLAKEARLHGDLRTANTMLHDLAHPRNGAASVFVLTSAGDAASRIGDMERADALFRAAHQRAPQDAVILNARARALRRAGRLAEAITSLEDAIDLEPWNVRHEIDCAVTLRELGHLDLARDHAARAAAIDDGNIYALVTLADIEVERGDFPAAEAAAQRALEIEDGPVARVALAAIALHRGTSLDEAGHQLDSALQRYPSNSRLHLMRGELALRAGNAERAMEEARTVRSLSPAEPDALAAALSLELRSGTSSPDEAVSAARRFPRSTRLIVAAARALSRANRQREARVIVEEGLRTVPESGYLLRELSELLEAQNDPRAAEHRDAAARLGLPPREHVPSGSAAAFAADATR